MKLRLRGDSLRLRVGPGEAAAIAAGRLLQESVSFGPASNQVLSYAVQASAEAQRMHATFEGNCIRVRVPLHQARSWYEGNEVGIEDSQVIDQSRSLTLLIEKDFACLENPEADTDDTYPNPAGAGAVCGDADGAAKIR